MIAYNAKTCEIYHIPKYGEYVADYRYADFRQLNLGGSTQEKQPDEAVRKLMTHLNIPLSIKESGNR